MADVVTVTCPDHHKLLVDGLFNSLTTKYLVDFAVDWNGQMIRAHQLVLDIFLPPGKLGLSNSRRRRGDVNLLLQFMYSGKVNLRREQVEDTLGVARMLDFKLMVDAMEAAIRQVQPDGSDGKGRCRRNPNAVQSLQGQKTVVTTPGKDDGVVSTLASTGDLNLEPNATSSSDSEDSDDTVASVVSENATKVKDRRRPDSNLATSDIGSNSARVDENSGIQPPIESSSSTINYKLRSSDAHSKNSNQERLKAKRPPGSSKFYCPTCKLSFPDKAALVRHSLLNHRKQRGRPQNYQPQINECPRPQIYQCLHCEHKTRCNNRLDVHVRRRHGKSNVDYFRCDKCATIFLERQKYESHLQKHRPYKCQHCSFTTEKKWNYENHLFREHRLSLTGKPTQPQQCDQCPYQGRNAAVLRCHVAARHTAEKPHKCTVAGCSYTARSKRAVVHHVRFTHLDERNFMCEFCSARKPTAAALAVHRRSHTGEKPFPCTICGRCFSARTGLKNHMALHTNPNDKAFLCHLCSFACKRRDNLRTHLKGKHKNEITNDELAAM